jgi:SAM-dependent methyltransferase
VRLLTTHGAPVGRPEVVCPVDGSAVHWDEAGLTCLSCGRTWERDGDVALFVPPDPAEDTAEHETEDDAPASRNDWRFLLPVDEKTRVLELGTRDDGAATALAFEAGSVVAVRESAADAIRLEARARSLALSTLSPVAAPLGVVPLADRSFDVAILHDALVRVSIDEKDPARAQRTLLRAVFRKLAPEGLLWAEMPNRFAMERFGHGWAASGGLHGLDSIRRLFAENGFPHLETFVVLHVDGRRELVPLADPTVFDFVMNRGAEGSRTEEAKEFAARQAFRAGLLPRLAPGFAFLATRGRAR